MPQPPQSPQEAPAFSARQEQAFKQFLSLIFCSLLCLLKSFIHASGSIPAKVERDIGKTVTAKG